MIFKLVVAEHRGRRWCGLAFRPEPDDGVPLAFPRIAVPVRAGVRGARATCARAAVL